MGDDVLDQAFGSEISRDWEYLQSRTTFVPRDFILDMVVRLSFRIPGNIVEFGVAEGDSTRLIRRVATECEANGPPEIKKQIYACDSFEGLREPFENAPIGAFKTTPPTIPGVEIVKGFFEESLTEALRARVGRSVCVSRRGSLQFDALCVAVADAAASRRQSVVVRRILGRKGIGKAGTGAVVGRDRNSGGDDRQFHSRPQRLGPQPGPAATFSSCCNMNGRRGVSRAAPAAPQMPRVRRFCG